MSQEASGLKEDRKKVFKQAFFMAAGTLTSRILGLLRDMALGALFDRAVTDAWTVAFRIPNLFRRLFGEGALSVSFVPVFIQARTEDSDGVRARNLVNGFYTFLLVFMGILTLFGILYMESILTFLLSDIYRVDGAKWFLTVRMARIMFAFVFCVTTYAYMMGLLNALGSFGIPAAAPALLNISMLLFTFLPGGWFPVEGDGLAWGVLVGGLLQMILVWWVLRRQNYLPKLQLKIWSSDIKHVLRNLLPGIAGLGLLQFSTLINLYFASALPEGSLSAIYWADRLLELPLSLISVSLGAALLPSLSELAAKKKWVKFRETSQETFLMTLFLAWPASLGLFYLAEPIVEILFLRGHFTSADVASTSAILKVYSVTLVVLSLSRVLMPSYYAIKNTLFPAAVTALCLVLHVLLAPFLMKEQGVVGLVTSGMLAAVLNVMILIYGLLYFGLAFDWGSSLKSVGKFLIAGVGMTAILKISFFTLDKMNQGLHVGALLLVILLAASTYLLLAAFLKCEEFVKIRPLFRL